MRSLKTYREILRKKGFYTCLRELKKVVWPVWWTHSKAAIEQIQAERTSKYLWRRYRNLIEKPLSSAVQDEPAKFIWLCWLQGLDQAPEIVRKCVASVKHYMPDYKVQILTEENIFDFVTLPEPIIRKFQNRKITFTHFSDILRTALLVQHGGVWLDATVLLTNSIPSQITDAPLFFLQKSILSSTPHAGSSWLLVAKKGDPVLQRVLDLLAAYWERENKLRDYYLFHLFLYLVLVKNPQGVQALKQIPYIPNVDAHTLQSSLFEDFSDEQWKQMTSRSSIHKLTYKYDGFGIDISKKGTFYDVIINGNKLYKQFR